MGETHHRRQRLAGILAACTVLGSVITAATVSGASSARHMPAQHPATARAVSLNVPAYQPPRVTPSSVNRDFYHCTLLDPKVTQASMIVGTNFSAGGPQVHHAILYLVYPNQVAQAKKLDRGGKGWSCFGAPNLNATASPIANLGATPWLGAWSPGHGPDTEPAGTGVPLPAGSMIVMQIHYNTLVGCNSAGYSPTDHSSVTLQLAPAVGSGLKPLHIDLFAAPPDIPCPAAQQVPANPLCNRASSIRDLGKRFGQPTVNFVNILERICGRSATNPPPSSSTSCTWGIGPGIVRTASAHMHLLGAAMTVTLNPGTASAQTLLNVPAYNFDFQRVYTLSNPVTIHSGDRVQVTCTFNPAIRSLLPQTRQLAPRFITWGEGSSDEMCLAVLGVTSN